jgi:predicted NUDIX family phosphoesterase
MLVIGELPEDEEVSVRETDQLLGEWINVEDLNKPEVFDNLETWSQFVVGVLI